MGGRWRVPDMSGGRVADPRAVVQIDQALDVYVLSVDRERERIALSLRHLTANPWVGVGRSGGNGRPVEGPRHERGPRRRSAGRGADRSGAGRLRAERGPRAGADRAEPAAPDGKPVGGSWAVWGEWEAGGGSPT